MRAAAPIPGESWPHEMVIAVEDSPHALLELLWVREAWQLSPEGGDLPPLLDRTPELEERTAVTVEERASWTRGWPLLWRSALAFAGKEFDQEAAALLPRTVDASAERARLIARLTGPRWLDRFGPRALTASFLRWQERERTVLGLRRPLSLDDTPERRSLDALVPAWRRGLRTVVVVPCRGAFARPVGASALVLTERDRRDERRFTEVLQGYRTE
ncbi:hypothetical protein N1031_18945 [Herbiconiux moechotypicola]|uniref:Uncharacterized protein n=1 Tax=Herbiconiux moechotypicola TaxID=637393 RepID=A0ABN3E4J9_9MICO|nr:hypothetical protein [Herbiconiux moechotypicola]MCS5731838.1 hypothetical protein [Herbiconiux moechotypicola]